MRKITFTILFVLLLTGCTYNRTPILKGLYQSEIDTSGYCIQISFQPEDNSFVEYIDNREVNKGVYKFSETNLYTLEGNKQDLEITLKDNNSFEIIIKKLNDGNPILLKNSSEIPGYFASVFDDVEEYEALLD